MYYMNKYTIYKGREKVFTGIRKSDAKATMAITQITPSSQHMFGGDHNQLANFSRI